MIITLVQAKAKLKDIHVRIDQAKEQLHTDKINRRSFENEIDFLTQEESKVFNIILDLKEGN